MKYLILAAVFLWIAALAGTLIFRGNDLAIGALLVTSLGLIGLGLWRSIQKK